MFYLRDEFEFEYRFRVGTNIPITRLIPGFEIRKNPNSYPNPIKTGKTRQFEFGSSG